MTATTLESPVGLEPASLLQENTIDIRSLFPTPVVTVGLDQAAALNAALGSLIRHRAESHVSAANSNLGGWQSEADFAQWGGQAGAAILKSATHLANMLTAVKEQSGLRRTEINWRVNCWANLNRPGDRNEMHTHAGAYWSGAYYVDDGRDSDEDVGGEFEILDPRGVAPLMYAPHLKIAVNSCLTAGLQECLSPRSGQMYMFPSWLFHGVRPYRGKRDRISIAFNLCL